MSINLAKLSDQAADAIESTDFERIDAALIEWAFDGADYEATTHGDALDSAIRTLETIDCSACAAPSGLIYTHDLHAKLSPLATEIEAAFESYEDATGEAYKVNTDHGLGGLVWFAYEWRAHELASLFESARASILEGLDPKWGAGFNMPGYMPDSEPGEFDSWEEARDYIREEIERADDENQDSETDEESELTAETQAAIAALDSLNAGEEFGRTVGGYHYWISRLANRQA